LYSIMPTPASISSTGVGIKKEMPSSSIITMTVVTWLLLEEFAPDRPILITTTRLWRSVQDLDARLSSPLGVG
jgi:hypothetical protein